MKDSLRLTESFANSFKSPSSTKKPSKVLMLSGITESQDLEKQSCNWETKSWPNYPWDSPTVTVTERARTFLERDSHQTKDTNWIEVPMGSTQGFAIMPPLLLVSTFLASREALN